MELIPVRYCMNWHVIAVEESEWESDETKELFSVSFPRLVIHPSTSSLSVSSV